MSQTIDIGKISVNTLGNYDPAYTYNKLDLVYHNGSSYVARRDNIVGIEPADNSSVAAAIVSAVAWMKAAGGTDLGTTLTDSGDMLHFDGTNISELPIGTAGQVLTVNSAGDLPEWTDFSVGTRQLVKEVTDNTYYSFSTGGFTDVNPLLDIDMEIMSPDAEFFIEYVMSTYATTSTYAGFLIYYGVVLSGQSTVTWYQAPNQGSNNGYEHYGYSTWNDLIPNNVKVTMTQSLYDSIEPEADGTRRLHTKIMAYSPSRVTYTNQYGRSVAKAIQQWNS